MLLTQETVGFLIARCCLCYEVASIRLYQKIRAINRERAQLKFKLHRKIGRSKAECGTRIVSINIGLVQ